ncbi:MAG: hypothetical protein OEW15_06395 [Nitrospirota bacterium]|nr:hypothetical protein [Nitrospirota bacterium]
MALPLVSVGGGEDVIHDWNFLLSHIGLLRWDQQVGTFLYLLGLIIILTSVVAAGYWSVDQQEDAAP